ncbi:hypothetical protein GCM10009869_33460 [Amnibacterium kyonggiense]
MTEYAYSRNDPCISCETSTSSIFSPATFGSVVLMRNGPSARVRPGRGDTGGRRGREADCRPRTDGAHVPEWHTA